ncbi:hypothetical protein NE237_019148 [Protea cynaroides]|uniref:Uncharacterized protein n=1 Tax=Protea cynaroides TaxID=273540 RepID=A0A9Q0KBB7_9MAGN|nr:hypothetical protein NE237_019148 [Protea cynaroides]
MADTEIAPFINILGYTLLVEVDSFHEVEDQLWSLFCLLTRLRSILMEFEKKQSEDLEEYMMEVGTLVHEAKVTVSYLDTTRKSGLVMDEAHKFRSKIGGFKSQIRGMMESNMWLRRFTKSSTSNISSLSKIPLLLRIILITRHDDVASHARSSTPPFYLRRLSKDEGRTLFSKRVTSLVDSHSHTQLDPNHYNTYHELVDARGGLPHAIFALPTEYHRHLLSTTNNEKDEESRLDKILPLEICECIYKSLPHHLKICLAYYHVLKEGYGFFNIKD